MDDPRRWVQITNDIRDKINSGELKPDSRVLLVRESQARGVTPETMRKAMQALENEGAVKRISGYGYFVIGR